MREATAPGVQNLGLCLDSWYKDVHKTGRANIVAE